MRGPLRRALWLLPIALQSLISTAGADVILQAGADSWRYLDDGSPRDDSWIRPGFDDSKWRSGRAPLGYGEARLGTRVEFGADESAKRVTTWFRRPFDAPELKAGDRLVLSLCVDDGAIIYLNGEEIGRFNMHAGRAHSDTLAAQTVDPANEGFYIRMPVPPRAARPGRNVLAVEVHQASKSSSDLFLDVAINRDADDGAAPTVADSAMEVVKAYRERHYVGPGMKIPDGYLDGGREMVIDDARHARSGREILRVDRNRDRELERELNFARSAGMRALPPLERARRIAAKIDEETTPPGGMRWVEQTTAQLEVEYRNRPVLIGDWIEQGRAGVCRHRSLIFKLLADEAGLESSLVRGNYFVQGSPGFPHAWNEIALDDGRRVLVDVMHDGGKPRFLDVTTPEVVEHYRKVDDTPWYSSATR